MTILAPFYVSLWLGYGLLSFILKKEEKDIHPGLRFVFSVGVGLGASSCIVFFSLLIFRHYNPWALWGMHFLIGTALFLKVRPDNDHAACNFKIRPRTLWKPAAASGLGLTVLYLAFITALHTPYGEWDGWALWNMKAKFIMQSGYAWPDLLKGTHQFTQPDYPLLLPCLLAWLASLTYDMPPYIPLITGVLFTSATGALLFFGLSQFIKPYLAALAAGLLVSLPFYMYAGTSQYADILLAFYWLSAFVCLMTALRETKERFFALSGVFLGLLSFTKNEGIFIAALIFSVTSFFLFKNKPSRYKENFRVFWKTTALAMLPVLIFKLLLSPSNQDILIRHFAPSSQFFNLEGCYMIFSSVIKQFFRPAWGYAWLLVGFAAFVNSRNYLKGEAKIMTLTVLLFLVALVLIYLATVNFSLMWRLSRTLPRILFYLYPSVLFLTFYAYGKKE